MVLAYKDLPVATGVITEEKERLEKLRHTLTKGRERLYDLRSSGKNRGTLYDALDAFPLTKFKQILEKAGVIELLKQRANMIVIAPSDEAFERIDPLIAAELNSARRLERLQTFARSHIIVAKQLFSDRGLDASSFDTIYDLNGDVVDLTLGVSGVTDTRGMQSLEEREVLIHAIHGVMPLDPFPHSEASITKGEVRVDNGWLIPVADVVVGKSFLEQKYIDRNNEVFRNDPSKRHTLWECFPRLGLTRFSRLIEEAGLIHLFTEPHENKATRPWIAVPIDETFININEYFSESLANPAVREDFIKSKIGTSDLLYGHAKTTLFSHSGPKFKASNGNFFLTTDGVRQKQMRWLRREFVPIDIDYVT